MRRDRILPYLRSRPEVPLALAALTVRLLGIVARPIWYDEAFAVLFASQGPARIAYGTLAPDALGSAADIHPLGYYTLLWAWMGIFSRTILAGRALSILIGCLTVWLGVRLMKALSGVRPAWWAGVFLVLSPFHVHYSQEIRMYGLLAFFLLGTTYVYLRALGFFGEREGMRRGLGERPRRESGGKSIGDETAVPLRGSGVRDWVLFAVLAALSMYTHNLAVFYLAPLALIPFWLPALRERIGAPRRKRTQKRRGTAGVGSTSGSDATRRAPPEDSPIRPFAPGACARHSPIRNTLLAAAGAVLLYSPWLVRLPGQFAKVSTSYWTVKPGGDRLVTTLLTFVTNLPVSNALLPYALLAAFLTLVLAAWQTLRPAFRRHPPEGLVPGLVLAYLAFTPPLLMFVVSQFVPVYVERALLPSGIVFVLWVAWALTGTSIPRFIRMFASIVLMVGMFIGLQTHLTYTGFPYAPYGGINDAIRTEIDAGDSDAVIVHSNKLTALPAYLLDPDLPHRYLPDIPGSGSDTLALPTQEVIDFYADADIEAAVRDAGRVWFLVFQREVDEYLAGGETAHPQLAWLDTRYTQVGSETWEDLIVYEYAAP